MMECYNRNFAKDFSKEKPELFEWCESLEKHANKRERIGGMQRADLSLMAKNGRM